MLLNIIKNFAIGGNVGNNMPNDPEDVRTVKTGLDVLDYNPYSAEESETQPHGYMTREMDTAVRDYQRAKGARVDGFLRPKGETEQAMRGDLYALMPEKEEEKEQQNTYYDPLEIKPLTQPKTSVNKPVIMDVLAQLIEAQSNGENENEQIINMPLDSNRTNSEVSKRSNFKMFNLQKISDDESSNNKPRTETGNSQNNCKDLEVKYINENAKVYILNQKIQKTNDQIDALKTKLAMLNVTLKQEKNEAIKAKVIGAGAGTVIGGTLGSKLGTAGVIGGMRAGFKAGKHIGTTIEKTDDRLKGNKDDIELKFEIKEIENEIFALQTKLQQELLPQLDRQRKTLGKAKEEYLQCKNPL